MHDTHHCIVIQGPVLYHDTGHVCIVLFQFHCFATHGSMTELYCTCSN